MYHFFTECKEENKDALIVEFPLGITDKEHLFAFYSWVFNFPGWFGYNWDALGDCLRDIKPLNSRRILIKHGDVPLLAGSDDRANYLDVLLSTCVLHKWTFVAAFPSETLDEIDDVILAYWEKRCRKNMTIDDVILEISSIVSSGEESDGNVL